MNPFVFSTAGRIVFQAGAAAALASEAGGRLGGRVLFVTDPGLRRLGLCDPALLSLQAVGIEADLFDRVEADPSLETVEAAAAMGREAGATGVVGFGGGSSLDVAKLAALLCGSGEAIGDAWGVGNARGPRLPLVLVPTTAGTGSEVTPVAIVTVDAADPPPLKWSALKYGFESLKEDGDGKTTQARRDRREAAAG